MSPIGQYSKQSFSVSKVLLSNEPDPHGELLAMIWGPRFDREHALGLWADVSSRSPVQALSLLPQLMALADRFDKLALPLQNRLRRLVLRHQSLQMASV